MTTRLFRFASVIAAFVLAAAPGPAAQGPIRVRLGTVVPKGSAWDESLQRIRVEWQRISNKSVQVPVLAGFTDEIDLVEKVRQGSLEAAGLSSVGLSHIDEGVACLQVPLMLQSYAELDHVRAGMAERLEKRIEAKGFKVLNWADGGWVHTFATRPVRTPDDLRKLKLFTSAGDPKTERLFEELGFNVVPLTMADMMLQLNTSALDAITTVPLFAMLQESYRLAPYMTDLAWTPLVGGTIIDLRAWNRIPAAIRPALVDAARAAGDTLRPRIRSLGDGAVPEMQKKGLKVVTLDAAQRAAWQKAAEGAYDKLRGRYCPADLFDEALRLRNEFRRSGAK
jgi:TRAP-type C4-dicarboxylate transport system substrate-binding protein